MKYVVEFTAGARQDLLKIYRYIKNEGLPETAKQFSMQIAQVCESLSENPERGSIPWELEGLSLNLCRQIIYKNLRVIYQIIGQTVLIYGIIDGRRSVREVMRQRLLL